MAGVFNINVHYYSEHRRRTCWWSWQATDKDGLWRVSITADYIPREELNVLDTSDMFTFAEEKLNEWKTVCDGRE